MFVLTESGRIVDDSSLPFKEYVDGRWVPVSDSMSLGDIMDGRVLSEEEVSQILKSGN